jgi:hypothetical protein
VPCLEHDGIVLFENDKIVSHALEFYKALFGEEQRCNFRLDEGFWQEEEKISPEENLLLEVNFSLRRKSSRPLKGLTQKGHLALMGFHLFSTRAFSSLLRWTLWFWLEDLNKGI